jgi:cytochrome c-type biogenesis protein CcmH/NrfG
MNGARILGEKRQYAPAAFLARRTMKLTRAPWRVHFMLGGIMYGQQYYGEALAAFEQDERENPFGADAILHQGKTLRQMNRFEEADVQCRRALRLVPNYPEAAVTIASLAYFRAEEARKTGGSRETALHLRHARVWLNYALNFFPRNAEALKLEGFVDIRERRWHDAASAWERYLSVKPADAEMRFRLDALRQDRLGKDRR